MALIKHPFSCVTWNLHRCRGNDGVIDPARSLRVLKDEVWQSGLDAMVLTEADGDGPPYPGLLDLQRLQAITGLHSVHDDPALRWGPESSGFVGIVLLINPAIKVLSAAILDLPGKVHRGAVVAEVMQEKYKFRIIGAHLSLSQMLRWAQMRVIAQHIQRHDAMPTVLVGDLNEWRPWGGFAFAHTAFQARFDGPAKPTFPVKRPILPLDRVLTTQGARVVSTTVLDGPGIRLSSDHRPLVAKVKFDPSS